MEPDFLAKLARAVFQVRYNRNVAKSKGAPPPEPALTVTPSLIGAQWTIENIHAELMGWKSSANARKEARRATRAALPHQRRA